MRILIMAVVYGVWSKEAAGTTALVMAFGLRRLVERVSPDVDSENAGYLIALLFLCVNYVYGLWLQRMAFATQANRAAARSVLDGGKRGVTLETGRA